MTESSTKTVDVLVVGSGNGALTAALCCYELGVKDVLVIEKAGMFGGTSATSGGGIWIPCNRYARAAGAQDSPQEAAEYLKHTLPPDAAPPEIIATYLEQGPKMVDFMHERTRVRYMTLDHYPDYYSFLPGAKGGHRSLEPEPVNRDVLGAEADRLIDSHHMMWLFDRIAFTQAEAQVLMSRSPGWKKLAARMIWDYLTDWPWKFTHRRSRRLTNGCAGITRLRWSMLERNIPLWLNTPFKELTTDASGRVTGAIVEHDGQRLEIKARKAVVLATGGFEHNQAMREQYLPKPTNTVWSAAAKTNTGDGIRAAMAVGAATRHMNGAWWCTTSQAPGEERPRTSIMEKSFPGNVVVNPKGKRIGNESQNYMAYQLEFFRKHSDANPQWPSWMVFDARFRRNYFVGPLLTSGFKPDWMIPKSYYTSGWLTKAGTVRELAEKAGIDAAGLEETISNMNEYARTGKDLELQRGDAAYDRYYGDPTCKPNPCLAPIKEAPFYAMRMEPGDFGTHGGVVIDTNARVLNGQGQPIEGLYAIGNTAAGILTTYPGPGSTLGPAMTVAFQAAKHITGRQP
jgi:3-oxosteroid 1-dehydrogenase